MFTESENSRNNGNGIIHNWNEYEAQELRISKDKVQSGPLLLSTELIWNMRHVPVFASAIFNPFGPTIETVSISEFTGSANRLILLRRSLHPFSPAWNQSLTLLSNIDTATDDNYQYQYDAIATILLLYIGNNATSESSRNWANQFIGTIPNGILLQHNCTFREVVKHGLAHLLQNAETQLADDIYRVNKYGTDLWAAVTPALHNSRCNSENTAILFPDISDIDTIKYIEPGKTFMQWWNLIIAEEYQRAVYQSIQEAWQRSGTIFFGGGLLQALGSEEEIDLSHDADFFSWWRLFDPNRRIL